MDHNGLGQVTAVSIPNGMTMACSYDSRNRMTKIEHKDGATVLDGNTYALDAGGEITRVTDQYSAYWDYTYDGRQRLVTAVRNNSGATIAATYRYTYDAGDNLVTKVEPFKDDFNDGDYTGWTAYLSTWDASNHYLTRTSGTAFIARTNTDGDVNLLFSYENRDTSNNNYMAEVYLRYTFTMDREILRIYPDKMQLYGKNTGGSYAVLDENTAAATTQDVWYDVYARCDGQDITVWRAQRGSGSEMAPVLSTSSAALTDTLMLSVTPASNASYALDDFRLVADNLTTTTTYTYTNPNRLAASTNSNDGYMNTDAAGGLMLLASFHWSPPPGNEQE